MDGRAGILLQRGSASDFDGVTVAICTYRRPSLAATLASIHRQTALRTTSLEVLVVDNDCQQSAAPIVQTFASQSPFPIRYEVVPERSIALARNRCLERAQHPWLAFIDDDEVAEPDWLDELRSAASRFGGAAVIGQVIPAYDPSAPQWIREGDPFARPLPAAGSVLMTGNTGNALLSMGVIRKLGLRFDERYGRTGGEDMAFFRALAAHGMSIISCPSAAVHEAIPAERLRLGYLRARAIRNGALYGCERHRASGNLTRLSAALRSFMIFPAALLAFATAKAFYHKRAIRFWQIAFLNQGKLLASLGSRPSVMY